MKEQRWQLVPVSQIRSSKYQNRDAVDDDKLNQMVESIRATGQSTPVLVRPLPPEPDSANPTAPLLPCFELISGGRRFLAIQKLGFTEIKSVVEEMTDQEAIIRISLENEVREDTNALQKAKGYKQMLGSPFFLTQEEIATHMGHKDTSTVSRHLVLLEQPAEIQKLLSESKITESHMRYLGRIEDPAKRIELAGDAASKGWGMRETAKHVRSAHAPSVKKSNKSAPEAPLEVNGFRLSWKGDEIAVQGRRYNPTQGSLDQFLTDLRVALETAMKEKYPDAAAAPLELLATAPAAAMSTPPTPSAVDTAAQLLAKAVTSEGWLSRVFKRPNDESSSPPEAEEKPIPLTVRKRSGPPRQS